MKIQSRTSVLLALAVFTAADARAQTCSTTTNPNVLRDLIPMNPTYTFNDADCLKAGGAVRQIQSGCKYCVRRNSTVLGHVDRAEESEAAARRAANTRAEARRQEAKEAPGKAIDNAINAAWRLRVLNRGAR